MNTLLEMKRGRYYDINSYSVWFIIDTVVSALLKIIQFDQLPSLAPWLVFMILGFISCFHLLNPSRSGWFAVSFTYEYHHHEVNKK